MGFVGSDLWKVRQKWGSGALVWPGVTVLPLNGEGKLWLGKRNDNGQWSTVGGYYELGDNAEACVRREVREELGLEISDMKMFGVITDLDVTRFTYPNGDEVQSPSHVFWARVEGQAHQDDEHSDHIWVSLEEAERMVQGTRLGYTTCALQMYASWLETKEFQIR